LFYLFEKRNASRSVAYKDKLEVTGFNKLRATISNLTVNDTGVFWCQYLRHDGPRNHETENKEGETLLVVNGKHTFILISEIHFVIWSNILEVSIAFTLNFPSSSFSR